MRWFERLSGKWAKKKKKKIHHSNERHNGWVVVDGTNEDKKSTTISCCAWMTWTFDYTSHTLNIWFPHLFSSVDRLKSQPSMWEKSGRKLFSAWKSENVLRLFNQFKQIPSSPLPPPCQCYTSENWFPLGVDSANDNDDDGLNGGMEMEKSNKVVVPWWNCVVSICRPSSLNCFSPL